MTRISLLKRKCLFEVNENPELKYYAKLKANQCEEKGNSPKITPNSSLRQAIGEQLSEHFSWLKMFPFANFYRTCS